MPVTYDESQESLDIREFLQEILRLKIREYSKCTNDTELAEMYLSDRLRSGNEFYWSLCEKAYYRCCSELARKEESRQSFNSIKRRIEEEEARSKAEERARKEKYKRELPEIKRLSKEISRKVCGTLKTCEDCPGFRPGKGWLSVDCPKYERGEDLGRLRVIYEWMNKE